MQKTKMKKRCRDGVTCVVLCTLPSIYLVCVVFGTAIPTSFYILENVFHTCNMIVLVHILRCSVFLLDVHHQELVAAVFDGMVQSKVSSLCLLL